MCPDTPNLKFPEAAPELLGTLKPLTQRSTSTWHHGTQHQLAGNSMPSNATMTTPRTLTVFHKHERHNNDSRNRAIIDIVPVQSILF
jgi:hypothetical protein